MRQIIHVGLEGHIGPWQNNKSIQSNSSFRRHVTIVNCLPVDIAIATRDGLRFIQERKSIIGESKLIIKVETHIDSNIKKQLTALLNSRDIENSKELEIAKSYWENLNTSSISGYNGDVFRVEYAIPIELIKRFGGTIYVKDIDYTFSIYGVSDDFYHPYSGAGEIIKGSHDSLRDNLQSVNEKFTASGSNFIRSIKIIDNAGTIGNQYIKIGSDIYVIKPHKEPGMRDGIYVLTNSPITNEIEKSEIIAERYDICDGVPYFKLYKTFLEALNDEVSAEIRKAELAIQDLQTREEETRNRTKRAELDAERLTVERDNFKQELEITKIKHMHEIEAYEQKLYLVREEHKTLRKKGFIEFARSAPIIITSLIGLFAFYKRTTIPKL